MSARHAATAWIIGCGDVGCRLALRLRDIGVSATGFVRSSDGMARLQRLGIAAQQLDLDASNPQRPLPDVPDWLFYAAPPPSKGCTDTRLRRLLPLLPGTPSRLIYFSTSGVSGDCGGRWIDESEPTRPAHDRSRRRLDAEHAVTDYVVDHNIPAVILRIPGIYGPGRLQASRLRDGRALVLPEQSPWSNRVHADDLADVALRAANTAGAQGVYNVSDGQPLTMTDYLQRCAVLLDLPAPPLLPLAEILSTASPMQREFLTESKRLRSTRALEELGWTPRTLETGLATCLLPDAVVAAARPHR